MTAAEETKLLLLLHRMQDNIETLTDNQKLLRRSCEAMLLRIEALEAQR